MLKLQCVIQPVVGGGKEESAFRQCYSATLDKDDRPGFQCFGNLLSVLNQFV